MKILKKQIQSGTQSSLELICNSDEDYWFLYNFIEKGDTITTKTSRKVKQETKNGSINTERVSFMITIKILSIDYQYDEYSETVGISLKGKSIEPNQYVALGQVLTIQVEINNPLTITKPAWSKQHTRLLEEALAQKFMEIAVLVLEDSLSIFVRISKNSQTVKSRTEKGTMKKFSAILDSMVKEIDFDHVAGIVLASSCNINEEFFKFIGQVIDKQENKSLKITSRRFPC